MLAGERMQSRFDEAGLALVEALVATGWSKASAAKRLGIARQRLYDRLAVLARRHRLDFDLPQTRVELSLEVWAARMSAWPEPPTDERVRALLLVGLRPPICRPGRTRDG